MEGSVRLFAGEFCQATLTVPDGDDRNAAWVVTPTGAYCRQVFLAGALTEVRENGDMVYARLADPTGGFDLSCGGKSSTVAETITKIPLPSFISLSGRAQLYRRGSEMILSIRPEYIRMIDRPTRDLWVLKTAQETLRRLETARLSLQGECPDERVATALRHYVMAPAQLNELATMAETAVGNVKSAEIVAEDQPDPRGLIIDLLKAIGSPRGMAVEEIIDTLAAQGIFQDAVLAAVEALILEDECYQPQKGFVRLL
jgi:RPA family protein